MLIELCWSENPADRPTFREIINRLTYIQNHFAHKRRWKVCFLSKSLLFIATADISTIYRTGYIIVFGKAIGTGGGIT
jgi:hypothetical protein